MIDQLSKTLKAFIKSWNNGQKTQSSAIDVVFRRPSDDFKPDNDTICMFLYDIFENVELRSNEPKVEYDYKANRAVVSKPPLRLSCSYLVTAWGGKNRSYLNEDEKEQIEQELLGRIIRLFSNFTSIPAEFLTESGLTISDGEPLPVLTLQKESNRNISELWSAMKCMIKPSFTVTITICVPHYEQDNSHLLKTVEINYKDGITGGRSQRYRVGGIVKCGDDAVANALIEIPELGISAISDSTGVFSFTDLPSGTYSINACVEGFYPVNEKELVVSNLDKGDFIINLHKK